MGNIKYEGEAVLVVGDLAVAYSLSACLLQAGHAVTLVSSEVEEAKRAIQRHRSDLIRRKRKAWEMERVQITAGLAGKSDFNLAFIVDGERLEEKREAVARLQRVLSAGAVIAINTESIPLRLLQEDALRPHRIIGANWVEPVHTTCFLELISNDGCDQAISEDLAALARERWGKDPYIIRGDLGIRAKMFSAMVREAFYLVQNDYASIEDIDRACRNDAGYYLPFAGNFRYMDLMGTYAYGMVMKELNPELSTQASTPPFFRKMMAEGAKGMVNGNGFYHYSEEQVTFWKERFRAFSYQIEEVIRKYPFDQPEKSTASGGS